MITRLTIQGMTSVHAVRAIETALAMVPGITGHEVTLGAATITHDGRATEDALREAVETAGYAVRALKVERRRLV